MISFQNKLLFLLSVFANYSMGLFHRVLLGHEYFVNICFGIFKSFCSLISRLNLTHVFSFVCQLNEFFYFNISAVFRNILSDRIQFFLLRKMYIFYTNLLWRIIFIKFIILLAGIQFTMLLVNNFNISLFCFLEVFFMLGYISLFIIKNFCLHSLKAYRNISLFNLDC